MADDTKSLDELIILQSNTDWGNEEQRRELPCKIYALIEKWEGQLPDLSNIFRPEQINWLILQDCMNEADRKIVNFAIRTGYKDKPDIGEDGKPLLHHGTPIHFWAEGEYDSSAVRELFMIYDRFDVNHIDDFGNTHFHVACRHGCEDVVEQFLNHGQDTYCLMPETDDSPLHLALQNHHKDVAALLLNAGANPNETNAEGSTPLHVICEHRYYESTRISCELSRDKLRPKMARIWDYKKTVKLLLSKGADPNVADAHGQTPLHIVCQDEDNLFILREFMKICKRKVKKRKSKRGRVALNIDARDVTGRTALYVALEYENLTVAKELLLRGADPNIADEDGWTPLHLICNSDFPPVLMQEFLTTSKGLSRPVQVDARCKNGWTPLQYAVIFIQPKKVDLLLEHGADLSNFVFPTKKYKDYASKCRHPTVIPRTLRIVISLERKGYQMDWTASLTVVRVFTRFRLFHRLMDINKRLCSGEDFARMTKSHLVTLNMSLYDLLHMLPAEEAEKPHMKEIWPKPWYQKPFHRYPYQTVAGRFFGRFALIFFARTDKEEQAIRRMTIKELWDACLAAAVEDYTYLFRRMHNLGCSEGSILL